MVKYSDKISIFGKVEFEMEEIEPQQRLWMGVLEQVIKDALLLKSDERYKRTWAKSAIMWVLLGKKDFEAVCLSAGFTREFVRDRFFKWLLSQYSKDDLAGVNGLHEFRSTK